MRIIISEDTNNFYGSKVKALDSSIEVIAINPMNPENPAWEDIPESDALFLSYQFLFAVRDNQKLFQPLLNLAKKMKFIQCGYAGMDDPLLQAVLKETKAIVANASGIFGIPISHYVLTQMLRWNKRVDQHIELQKKATWSPLGGDGELTGKTLVILGYGGIGKEVAKLAKAFGMNVIGIRRSPADCEFADEVHRNEKIEELLPMLDFLVMALPDSEETRDIIDKDLLKKMNKNSMLINVGRGTAIVEDDLAEALNTGEIASAALDTTKIEPLSKDSKLWTAQNCYISAHDSAHSLLSLPRAFNLFLENVVNVKKNQPIKNLFPR